MNIKTIIYLMAGVILGDILGYLIAKLIFKD